MLRGQQFQIQNTSVTNFAPLAKRDFSKDRRKLIFEWRQNKDTNQN
jgi:hypothetical protein